MSRRITQCFLDETDGCYFNHLLQSFIFVDSELSRFCLAQIETGCDIQSLVKDIVTVFGKPAEEVSKDLEQLVPGVLDSCLPYPTSIASNAEIFRNANRPAEIPCNLSAVREIAGISVRIGFNAPAELSAFQHITFGSLATENKADLCDIAIVRTDDNYCVKTNSTVLDENISLNTACLYAYNIAEDLAAKRLDPLVIFHAGGIQHKTSKKVAIFPGLGNTGKSTLMYGLASQGHGLLNDDVIPFLEHGSIMALGSTVKLREGSWQLCSSQQSILNTIPTILSDAERLKLIRFENDATEQLQQAGVNLRASHIIVPEYNPAAEPQTIEISKSTALQAIISAESIFKKPVTHKAIAQLSEWLRNTICYKIRYHNLETALIQTDKILTTG